MPNAVKWGTAAAVAVAGLTVGVVFATDVAGSSGDRPVVTVYKSPTCGCCSQWAEHLEASGFDVEAVDVSNLSEIKALNGITRNLASCHTAIVDGYVIEGHVPAADIQRLLEERPEIAGLAVPGMPIGSPGMEGPNPEQYEVLAFDQRGGLTVWARH